MALQLLLWAMPTLPVRYLRLYVLRFKILIFCFFLSLSGCYSYNTEIVNIKVKVDSKVSMSKYSSLAVIGFSDMKNKHGEEYGKVLSRMIRKQLKESENFKVLDERDTLFGDELGSDDPETLVDISKQLDVDALIVGKYDFGQRYQAVPYIAERYYPASRYRPEGRTYIQKVYYLKFYAKLVDGTTGETIFEFSPPMEERPDYSNSTGLPFLSSSAEPSNLRTIAAKSVKNFVLSLMPHYEKERRILVR